MEEQGEVIYYARSLQVITHENAEQIKSVCLEIIRFV
jgi:hypothetical protein